MPDFNEQMRDVDEDMIEVLSLGDQIEVSFYERDTQNTMLFTPQGARMFAAMLRRCADHITKEKKDA